MKKKSIKKSLKKTTIKGGEEPYISAIIGNPPGKFVPDNIKEEVDLGHREAIIKKYEDKKKTADEKYRILNENYKDNDTPEVGDNLVCHKSVVMQYSGEVEATEGKLYEIILVTHDRLAIINNSNHEHFFSIKKGDDSFYKKWFSPSMSIEIDTFFEPLD